MVENLDFDARRRRLLLHKVRLLRNIQACIRDIRDAQEGLESRPHVRHNQRIVQEPRLVALDEVDVQLTNATMLLSQQMDVLRDLLRADPEQPGYRAPRYHQHRTMENNGANFETDFCDCELARIPAMLVFLAHNGNTVCPTIQRQINAAIILAYAHLARRQPVQGFDGGDLHGDNDNGNIAE